MKGLEIVELGNCGFEDWSVLKGLAGQAGITSLGLKGNGVIEDVGDGVDAFEGFKSKVGLIQCFEDEVLMRNTGRRLRSCYLR